MTRSRAKLIGGGLVMAGAIAYLGFTGVRSGWVYYLDVDEYVRRAETHDQRARVHGVVADEGVDSRPAELYARFVLVGESKRVAVEYRGAIPDMFQCGREVVVEGRMGPDGVFLADVLMTKCASKYEAREEPAAGAAGGST